MTSALLSFIVAAAGFLGCLNEYDLNRSKEGAQAVWSLETPKPARPWITVRRELEMKLTRERSKETLNDLAVVYIRFGEIKRAIPLLEEVERRFPGAYRTATNLGTAYELDGRNEDALRWIQEGIRRNKDSHEGTEWLHVRILQAKLALAKDPKWLESHRVSGIERDPKTGSEQMPDGIPPKIVWSALQYQLRERLPFTPQKDLIVGQLLADYAELTHQITSDLAATMVLTRLAMSYTSGNPPPELAPGEKPILERTKQ